MHLGDDGIITEVSQHVGDLFHARQTLTGDTTDNYPGLKGFGPAKAEALIKASNGNREFLWGSIQQAYAKAGHSRDEMLVQARVARILTADWFDFDNKQPIPWEPPT